MNFQKIDKKLNFYQKHKSILKNDIAFIKNFEENFAIRYTHESTSIEGNTLTLRETRDVLIHNKSIANKDLRELYEVINHKVAFQYLIKQLSKNKLLDSEIANELHKRVMERIQKGGIYRTAPVYITGSKNDLPHYQDVPRLMKEFYENMQGKAASLHPIEYACWTHATFVNIHPFSDGNGRTARLMMNYQLMSSGYLPVSIPTETRTTYCKVLDQYQTTGDRKDLEPFIKMVVDLEEKQLDIIIEAQKALLQDLEMEM